MPETDVMVIWHPPPVSIESDSQIVSVASWCCPSPYVIIRHVWRPFDADIFTQGCDTPGLRSTTGESVFLIGVIASFGIFCLTIVLRNPSVSRYWPADVSLRIAVTDNGVHAATSVVGSLCKYGQVTGVEKYLMRAFHPAKVPLSCLEMGLSPDKAPWIVRRFVALAS